MNISIDLGDVPTWLSSTAAIFALLYARKAARAAFDVFQIESARDRESEKERLTRFQELRRDQAVSVAAWFAAEGDKTETVPGIYIRNGSSAPVYDLSISLVDHSGHLYGQLASVVLGPSEAPRFFPLEAVPHHTMRVRTGSGSDGFAILHPPQGIRVVVAFMDSRGIRWQRSASGELSELT